MDGADHRLHGVRQYRGLLAPVGEIFPATQSQVRADIQVDRHLGQGMGIDDRCPHLGELTVIQIRPGVKRVLSHNHSEYGIAQELQALVGLSSMFGTPRTMGHRLSQETRVHKVVPNPFGQGTVAVGGADGGHRVKYGRQDAPSLACT